jgi:hypothetical protein
MVRELRGANMEIDFEPADWEQDKCPWSEADGKEHLCAVKGVSLCKHFKGIRAPDVLLCAYEDKGV